MKLLFALLIPAQGVSISPQTDAELQGVLEKLAQQNKAPAWCEADCATFYEVGFSGDLAAGELRFTLTGAVTSSEHAYVELFGTRPAALVEATVNGRPLALFWSGAAYSAALPPGDFAISGRITTPKNAAVTLKIPGPAGLVKLDVPGADVVGTGERRGVKGATYQLAPKVTGKEERVERLRLQIERRFELARDKTFSVTVSASGARPGQVIRLPLLAGESVEDLDAGTAHVQKQGAERWLDWVASGPSPSLSYGGKWTAESIALVAAPGAVKETWRVRCDDPYLCSFAGDAEPLTGESAHVWAPLAAQKLEVAWRELAPLAGVHTVAQEVALATKPVGRNLQQRMQVRWTSSSGALVSVTLPKDAQVSRFELDGAKIPILKDAAGAVQISLPAGKSVLDADWELAKIASSLIRPPVPVFSEPVGTLWHRVFPAEAASVITTGGLPGSPRVALWPSMAASLVIALVLAWLARVTDRPLASEKLWIPAALGFAILSPAAALPLALALGFGRFIERTASARGRFRIFVELGFWGFLVAGAVTLVFVTLEHALFASVPMEVTSFVYGGSVPAANEWGYEPLIWGAYLAGDPQARAALPTPYVLTVPVVVLRLAWAAWGVTVALFLAREGRVLLQQLAAYWSAAGWSTRTAKS